MSCHISGWVRFMPLGWLVSTFSASSAPCTISVGLWWPPMCHTRGSSRPPNPTTSIWVCSSSSSFSVYYLLSTQSWPCHLHLTVDLSGIYTHNNTQTYQIIAVRQPSWIFILTPLHTDHVGFTCLQWEAEDVWCDHGDNWNGPASLHGDTVQLCC